MKKRIAVLCLVVLALTLCASMYAQMVKRPFHNGSVWTITFVRVKPGMDVAYMTYLSGLWKREQEALKKEGIVLSYKVIATEGHTTADFNLMLMSEYKDLATLEASDKKADAMAQQMVGNDLQQQQGYRERAEIREILGNRLAREIVLEPEK